MIFIDSHCHINDDALFPKRKEIIEEARQRGVSIFIVPGWDMESSEKAIAIAHEFEGVYAAVGFHPENLENISDEALSRIEAMAKDEKVVAIGEIGLDYHWFKEEKDRSNQKRWFIKQIELANKLNLPASIHCREASEDTLLLLKEHPLKASGVLHCYSGSTELLREYAKLGLFFGFDGPITYKNAITPKNNATFCPIDRILSETDSPYLSPTPYRGHENHPAFVKEVVLQMASLRGISVEEMTSAIVNNTKNLFHVEQKR